DDAAHGCRTRARVARENPDRRSGRDAARGERARREHGVPVLRSVSAHDGAGERVLWPALDAHRQGEGAQARAREARYARTLRSRAAAAVRALGRAAAACRRSTLTGARAGGVAVRRAAVESRREAAPPGAAGDP